MQYKLLSRELGEFGTNCYILACQATKQCVVIDPGVPSSWIAELLKENQLKPVAVLLTHGHLDHIGGAGKVKAETGAPIWVHGEDAPMLTNPELNGSAYFGSPVTAPAPDRLLKDGDQIPVGNLTLTVLHTPGHTMGGVCFYLPPEDGENGLLIAGDTLFAGSVGRSDLYGGDHGQLIRSIREKLLPLPSETSVYPGHGPATSIGDEKEYNPFL